MNRVLTAARLQLVHPAVILGMPWAVVASSFVINWAVWKLADLENQVLDDPEVLHSASATWPPAGRMQHSGRRSAPGTSAPPS